jgi:Glycosyltransferase family 92
MKARRRTELSGYILCWIFGFLSRSFFITHSSYFQQIQITGSGDQAAGPPSGDGTNLPPVTAFHELQPVAKPNASLIHSNESFSACLLVMDENFRLYEWLTYHYHVLKLRYVVIAVDPLSLLSPGPVLDLFRNELNMTIITWTDRDFADWKRLRKTTSSDKLGRRYLRRQRLFLSKCMEHMHQQGRTWTAMWDVDEYIIFNGYNRAIGNITTPNDLVEPGCMLDYIEQADENLCYPMMRLEVGTKEDPPTLRNISIPNLDPLRFDTLRYRYTSNWDWEGNGLGKMFINSKYVDPPVEVLSPHRPAHMICPAAFGKVVQESPFIILHYVGSWEAFTFRNDPRSAMLRTAEKWEYRGNLTDIFEPNTDTWMEGFIRDVGKQRAWRLLRHAGLPDGYNGSKSNYEAFHATEALRYS